MKDGGFGCTGDISRGSTLSRWSTPAGTNFDNGSFAPIYRSRSGLPRQKIALPRQNRAWIFFRLKSSVDNLPLCHSIESKVADYPRSFTRREIFHARTSDNPRSVGQPSSTRLLSRSVTYREHFLPYLLQVEILSRDPSLRLIL